MSNVFDVDGDTIVIEKGLVRQCWMLGLNPSEIASRSIRWEMSQLAFNESDEIKSENVLLELLEREKRVLGVCEE